MGVGELDVEELVVLVELVRVEDVLDVVNGELVADEWVVVSDVDVTVVIVVLV